MFATSFYTHTTNYENVFLTNRLHVFGCVYSALILTCTCNWSENVTINPLSPMSDCDRISPYNINTISTRYMIRIKKNFNLRIIS